MKRLGSKIEHYNLGEKGYEFVIFAHSGDVIKKYPKDVKVESLWMYDGNTEFLFELTFADGRKEFFLEKEHDKIVYYIESMDNAEGLKIIEEDVLYKKEGLWYWLRNSKDDRLLGKEIIDRVFVVEYPGKKDGRYCITNYLVPVAESIESNHYLKAKDYHGQDVVLANEVGKNVGDYLLFDGKKPYKRHAKEGEEFFEVDGYKERFFWNPENGTLRKLYKVKV